MMVKNGINVLSVFDGICAGRLGLERAGIEINNYYGSEIDKFANKVTEFRYPQNIQLGDVTKWREWDIDWSSIDLFIGGSPCQGFSVAGKQGGTKAVLNGEEILVTDRETYFKMKSMGAEFKSQSHLFWEYVLIYDNIKRYNPNVKFLLENVRMKKELLRMISDALSVEDMVINSSLLSAQNRVRHYWFNWEVKQPVDKGILLRDILEDTLHPYKEPISKDKAVKIFNVNPSGNGMNGNVYHVDAKSPTLTTNKGEGIKITEQRIIACNNTSEKEYQLLNLVDGEVRVKQATKKGYIVAEDGDGVNLSLPTSKTRRGRVIKQKSPTLETSCNVGVVIGNCTRIKKGDVGHVANVNDIKGMECIKRVYGKEGKSPTITTMGGGHREPKVLVNDYHYRKLTPTECARLQTFPDGWAEEIVSKSQAYKQYGNSWTVDVISHIFSGVKDELSENVKGRLSRDT